MNKAKKEVKKKAIKQAEKKKSEPKKSFFSKFKGLING